jgi:hypothetical protein
MAVDGRQVANIFRRAALALPQVTEQGHFGAPSFRVRGKIFAQLSSDETIALLKLSKDVQQWAITTYPRICRVEPQWGKHGWTCMEWAAIPLDLLEDWLTSSWRAVTPRALHALLPPRLPGLPILPD